MSAPDVSLLLVPARISPRSHHRDSTRYQRKRPCRCTRRCTGCSQRGPASDAGAIVALRGRDGLAITTLRDAHGVPACLCKGAFSSGHVSRIGGIVIGVPAGGAGRSGIECSGERHQGSLALRLCSTPSEHSAPCLVSFVVVAVGHERLCLHHAHLSVTDHRCDDTAT